jgi:hypothetical protein
MKTTYEDTLLALSALNPVDAGALRTELDDADLDRAIRHAIELGENPRSPIPAGDAAARSFRARGPRGSRHLPLALRGLGNRGLVLAGGLTALVAALVLALAGVFSTGGAHPPYAAAAIRVAEDNPRLLVTAPGWKITDASQFETHYGRVTFRDGGRELELDWYPTGLYRGMLRDRSRVSRPRHSELLGGAATTVDYGHDDFATMLAPTGKVFVEVRGSVGDRTAYDEVVGSLRDVDVDTWLAAMPASVVAPSERPSVVAKMLRGIPLPPHFDASHLEAEAAVDDHYDLGVKVASAVSCGWVESWLAARNAGDAATEAAAVTAMATSHHWPLLAQMQREQHGGWALNVWHFAGELKRGRLAQDFGSELVNPDGSGYKIGPAWATGLDCTSRIRKVPLG